MKTIPLTIFLGLGPLMAAVSVVRGGGLPQAPTVEAQPLWLQTERLVEAMASVGAPIESGRLERLQALQQETDEAVITRAVQAELDALSIAAIVVAADGSISARPRGEPVILDENGWRTVLVKVINGGGLTGQLKLESPHARPIPHGPASEVDDRWMGLSVFSGRPLAPSLSGLGLEYRLIQVYGSRPGSQSGRLELSISDAAGGGSPVLKKWRFDRDADGWGAPHACSLAVRDGSLWISQTGEDPYFSSSVSGRGGRLRLRWQGVSDEDGVAQVFWWTRDDPAPSGSRSVGIPITAGRDGVNEVEFQVEGELAGLRIDPNVGPGRTRIDWIDLERVSGDQAVWAPVIQFICRAASTRSAARTVLRAFPKLNRS